MDNLILTEEHQGVFTITLNRFDKKNALNTLMYQKLCQLFTYANDNNDIRCLVIRGNENCFCAGNDLQDFIESSTSDEIIALTFLSILARFTKPIVAAVAGPAVGIGTTLLLHCDMVIAANNCKFKLPFTQLGLSPEGGSSLLLPQLVGRNRAFELLVLGNTFDHTQAKEYGIVNQICLPEELISISNKTALTIAALPHDAVMASRKLIRENSSALLLQTIENEGKQFSQLLNTDECKNILKQFFNH